MESKYFSIQDYYNTDQSCRNTLISFKKLYHYYPSPSQHRYLFDLSSRLVDAARRFVLLDPSSRPRIRSRSKRAFDSALLNPMYRISIDFVRAWPVSYISRSRSTSRCGVFLKALFDGNVFLNTASLIWSMVSCIRNQEWHFYGRKTYQLRKPPVFLGRDFCDLATQERTDIVRGTAQHAIEHFSPWIGLIKQLL